jgi:solute carrier family 34 (sodium-dependent phosphate cotransporter)
MQSYQHRVSPPQYDERVHRQPQHFHHSRGEPRGGRMTMAPPLVATRNNGHAAMGDTPLSLEDSYDHSPAVTPAHGNGSPDSGKYYLQGVDMEAEEAYADQSTARKVLLGFFYLVLVLAALYVFMVAIKLIETGLTLAFGCNYRGAFDFANNPVAGLMIGTVATALVHSSSTVTSVAVALVGTGAMTIRQGVFVVMGANVGTCITCIIVAFAQVRDRTQFERAMAAATVHDMYNIWSVIVMFPLEVVLHPLEMLGKALAHAHGGGTFTSPLDTIVNPLTDLVLAVNKSAIEDVATGKTAECSARTLVKSGIFQPTSLSNGAIGGIVAAMGFLTLICALLTLVRVMARVFLGPTKRVVARALDYNGYLNILVGAALTFWVHSSTLVTSTLTPMAGLGVISLEKVYPLVIGANVGTTGTALLAGMVTGKKNAVALAFVHVFFNLFGILLFYPIPITRKPIFLWAKSLASWSAAWPFCAVIFIAICFVVVPTVSLGLTYMCTADNVPTKVLGWVLCAAVLAMAAALWYWYAESTGREAWSRFLERKRTQRAARHAHHEGMRTTAIPTHVMSHDDSIPVV